MKNIENSPWVDFKVEVPIDPGVFGFNGYVLGLAILSKWGAISKKGDC